VQVIQLFIHHSPRKVCTNKAPSTCLSASPKSDMETMDNNKDVRSKCPAGSTLTGCYAKTHAEQHLRIF